MNSLVSAAVIGVVQGLTEFLPVSSSGHIVLAQQWLGWNPSSITLEVVVHLATTGSVLVFFRRSLLQLMREWWALILVGSVPAGVVGILFKDSIEQFFSSVLLVGVALICTGVLNLFVDWKLRRQPVGKTVVGFFDALLIGVAQAVAITPGISRSGSTVAAGIGVGLDRENAFQFSFLLSIPAILGAALLELPKADGSIALSALLVAGLAAFSTGLATLGLLRWMLTKAQLHWFGIYAVVLGLAVVSWQLLAGAV